MIDQMITWDKAFCVGHEKIDAQHKKLFDIAQELHEYRNDKKKILVILKELLSYTKYHFTDEEKYMESINYKDLENHKKRHVAIINSLVHTVANINSFTMDELFQKLAVIINEYIVKHILIEDKKFHHQRRSRDELKLHFKWKSEYKIFDEMIDAEHKELFEIALRALTYHDGMDIRNHVKLTITELYNYMKTHFRNEEIYMEKIGYPELEEHKKIHASIIESMNLFIKKLPTLKILEFEKKLIEYMDIWLIGHILYEDRKIISFKKNSTK